MRKCLLALFGLTIVGGVLGCVCSESRAQSTASSATAAGRNAARQIVALGTVEPEEVVEVCAQVPGRIVSLGADPVAKGKSIDFGSKVEPGTVLAQVDSEPYKLRVEHEQAGCARAEAERFAAQAKLELAEARWQRAQKVGKGPSAPETDSGMAKLNYKVAQASAAAAEAAVAQQRAALKEAQLKLGYTRITSPIKGVAGRAA